MRDIKDYEGLYAIDEDGNVLKIYLRFFFYFAGMSTRFAVSQQHCFTLLFSYTSRRIAGFIIAMTI